jgi:hypothetical protein
MKKFNFEKMTHEEMSPIHGGSSQAASASTTRRNQTTSSGADNDSKSGDQDQDFVQSYSDDLLLFENEYPVNPGEIEITDTLNIQ